MVARLPATWAILPVPPLSTCRGGPHARSGIVRAADIEDVLANPSEHIESAKHFSWERFFTDYLRHITEDTSLHYTKGHLNPAYLEPKNMRRIIAAI